MTPCEQSALRRRCTVIPTVADMETNNNTTTTTEDAPSPGIRRRLATRLLVGAGTITVVLLSSETLALAKPPRWPR